MSERYIHYSRAPLRKPYSVAQEKTVRDGMKPQGLWFSVETPTSEDGWREWCLAEDYGIPNLTCATELTFAPEARIKRLISADDIDRLTQDYGLAIPGFRTGRISFLDWPRLAATHDAIIIAPYIWKRRLHDKSAWYYGWDCASGCVWNAKAVAKCEPIMATRPHHRLSA
jgi:hypothetical protein